VDEAGNIVSSDDYAPWGMILNGRSTNLAYNSAKYKFTGKELDTETGYFHFDWRPYDGRIGRWMQVDPLAKKYPGWSPYNYGLNNPLKFFDLKGMQAESNDEARPRETAASLGQKIYTRFQDIMNSLGSFFAIETRNETKISQEQLYAEKNINAGLTNKQITELQLHTVNTVAGIVTSTEITSTSIVLSAAGMGAETKLISGLLGFSSVAAGWSSNYINGEMTGNYNFTSTGVSATLTGASLLISNPVLKIGLGISEIGFGINLTSFNYAQQEWNKVKNISNF
jgi:RHS repeat-associated protein